MQLAHAVGRWLSGFGLDGGFLLMRFILKSRQAESFVDINYRHLVANFVGRVAACMAGPTAHGHVCNVDAGMSCGMTIKKKKNF